ncbi:unnamed protein product [Hapterophycus canaliculatus]
MAALKLGGSAVDSFLSPHAIKSCSGSINRSCASEGQHERRGRRSPPSATRMAATVEIGAFPYEDVLPFLKEHVQPSDQMLLMGCGTELPLQLSRDGYGARQDVVNHRSQHGRWFIRCIDSDPDLVAAIRAKAEEDPVCSEHMAAGQLVFQSVDIGGGMPELTQSSVDCVVDVGLLDKLVTTQGVDAAKACSDAAHRAVRLGNPLVALSMIDKDDFGQIFDGNWGWMQELDGDPGAVSQWYRDKKVNIKDVGNNFVELGISFFVYTNVDNC